MTKRKSRTWFHADQLDVATLTHVSGMAIGGKTAYWTLAATEDNQLQLSDLRLSRIVFNLNFHLSNYVAGDVSWSLWWGLLLTGDTTNDTLGGSHVVTSAPPHHMFANNNMETWLWREPINPFMGAVKAENGDLTWTWKDQVQIRNGRGIRIHSGESIHFCVAVSDLIGTSISTYTIKVKPNVLELYESLT